MGLKKLLAQSITWRSFYFFSVLLVNVFLSRYLQAAGTGSLYFTTILFSFVHIILSLSADSALIYFGSGNVIERNKLLSLSATWSLVAGVAMILLVYAYFMLTGAADSKLVYWYAAFGFLYVAGQSLTSYSIALYYTRENYHTPNLLPGLVNIVFVLFIPGKEARHTADSTLWITLLYFATFFIGGLLLVLTYFLQFKKDSRLGFPRRDEIKKLAAYAFTALGANAVFFLVYRVDYLFVKYSPVCTDADLGNYIQVSKLGQMTLILPQIIASVVFPKTAGGAELGNAIATIARIFSQLFLLAFVVVLVAGQQLFTLVFGESFDKMQLPMLILIPGMLALSLQALLAAYFSGKGKIKVNLYAAITGLIVMMAGDLIFVPLYGIVAAAAVSTVSYAANVGFSLWKFNKDFSVRWIEFFRWKKADYDWLLSYLKFNKA